ncbi:MAG: acyl-CoA dehydrogenase, partial [bacterium]|nr:acyl-CoA dehydrogenase [bacterium]
VNEDGTLGEHNDVVCTGIEEKMGMHTSPTCSLTFGGKGKCRGTLLGEENKGMRAMFHLMNAARLLVGTIGQTSASTAYLLALNYAKERLQGRALENAMDQEAPQVPIIQHPDVRRMLTWMKANVEGMRSLMYFGSLCIDKEKCAETEEERNYYKGLLDLLTPVIKSYCTDKGFEVCSEAVQVYGGYG